MQISMKAIPKSLELETVVDLNVSLAAEASAQKTSLVEVEQIVGSRTIVF
jgi:hypothetical protein